MTAIAVTRGISRRKFFGLNASSIAACYLGLILVVSLLAPVIAPYGLNQPDYNAFNDGPSLSHLLGTDQLGRDVLSRLMFGGQVSYEAMAVAVGVAAVVGIPIGVLAGYLGGWAEDVIMRIADALLAFPTLLLAIAVSAALGTGTARVMLGVGIVLSPSFIRMARIQTRVISNRLYVDAARSFGKSPLWTVRWHIAPNGFQPLYPLTAHMFGVVLIVEASLSFLGLGAPPPSASWGSMLKDASQYTPGLTIQTIAPGLAIATVLLAINIIGDSMRDSLDPRLTRRLDRASA
jgi:peptide/nickel transport system permease protein